MSDEVSVALLLPPEVWGEIATYLDAAELKKLDHLGNHHLHACLRRGVYHIHFNNLNGVFHDDEWPAAALSRFPKLESLTLRRNDFYPNYGFPLLPTHLASLPSLYKLDLSGFYMPFSSPHWNRSRKTEQMLSSLPRTLVWLSLPYIDMIDEDTVLLPQSLTYLALLRSYFTSAGLGTLPVNLLHLKIGTHFGNGPLKFDQVPPELQAFQIRHKFMTYPEEVICTFPRHTVHLRLDADMRISYRTIKALPENLKVLRLAHACLFDDSAGRHLSFPLTVTDLEMGSLDSEQVTQEFMEHLPQGLTAFRLNNASHLKPSWLAHIPRTVTVLTLKNALKLDATALSALPKKLVKITIGGVQGDLPDWASHLPPTVTHLNTGTTVDGHWGSFAHTRRSPNLIRWTNNWYPYRHLYEHINWYEKPTLARRACQVLANADIPIVGLSSLFTIFACLLAVRNMSTILPRISTEFKGIFTKSHDLILRASVKMLHNLK